LIGVFWIGPLVIVIADGDIVLFSVPLSKIIELFAVLPSVRTLDRLNGKKGAIV
jgi:hypothetical protein